MGVGGKRLGSPPAAAGSQPFAALFACACCQWNYTLVCLFPEELCLTRNLWKACNLHITRGKHVTYELFALVDLRQWGLLSSPPLVTHDSVGWDSMAEVLSSQQLSQQTWAGQSDIASAKETFVSYQSCPQWGPDVNVFLSQNASTDGHWNPLHRAPWLQSLNNSFIFPLAWGGPQRWNMSQYFTSIFRQPKPWKAPCSCHLVVSSGKEQGQPRHLALGVGCGKGGNNPNSVFQVRREMGEGMMFLPENKSTRDNNEVGLRFGGQFYIIPLCFTPNWMEAWWQKK